MSIDYRVRGVHYGENADGLKFQVLCYGVPDPGRDSIEKRISNRGLHAMIDDKLSHHCTDKFDGFGSGKLPGRQSVFQVDRHFFNRRIDDIVPVQVRPDQSAVGALHGTSGLGCGAGGAGQVEEGRDDSDHQGRGEAE